MATNVAIGQSHREMSSHTPYSRTISTEEMHRVRREPHAYPLAFVRRNAKARANHACRATVEHDGEVLLGTDLLHEVDPAAK
jgi:hypothetical protein